MSARAFFKCKKCVYYSCSRNIISDFVFDIQENYVNVVIPFNKDVLDNHGIGSGTLNGTLNGTLSDKEQMVVNELLNNASATYEEMTHKTGISRRTLTRIMTTLQEKGVLERVGSKRDGRWVVLK